MNNNAKILRTAAVSAVFLIFFFFYISNMAPTYNSDDSPETSVAFYTLGIQHPPGYPLDTLIGKIFTYIPLAGIAFRANMMAVIFNMLAAFMLFFTARPMAARFMGARDGWETDLAGITASALYLFSASAWLQGSFAKGSIYALNAFLLVLCVWSLFKTHESKKYLYFFAFIYGLSMGNHWTSMAVIAPAVIYYLVSKRKYITLKALSIAAVFFAAGAAVYLFVWLRNATHPVYVWGDVKSLKDFIWLISRAQYAGAENKHSIGASAHLLSFYIKNLFTKEYPLFLAVLFLPGVFLAIKQFFKEGMTMLAAYVLITVSVTWFATPPAKTEWIIKPYLVSTNVFMALFISCAVSYCISVIGRNARLIASAGAALVITVLLLVFNRPGYARYFIGYDYSSNLAKSLPDGSIFITEGDMNVGAVLYLTLVEKKHFTPVIPVVMMYDWYIGQVKRNYGSRITLPQNKGNTPADFIVAIINANPDRPIFYSNVFNNGFVNPAILNSTGIVFKIMRMNERRVITDAPLTIYSYRGLAGEKQDYDEFTQRLVVDNYAMAYYNFADALRNAQNTSRSIAYYERGLLFSKNSGAYINLGLAYYNMANLNKAEECWNEALKYGPQDPSIIYTNLAFVYLSRKQPAIASEYVAKALAANPGNQTALQLKAAIK